MAAQLGQRGARAQPPAVRALGGHRVPGVGRQDDPRLERDLVALDAVWIAAAVQAFVVMTDHAGLGIHAEASQQALACRGVVLNPLVLGGGQRARLSQDGGSDRELAHVVDDRRAGQDHQPVDAEPQLAPGGHRQDGDAAAVRVGGRVVSRQVGGQHRDERDRGSPSIAREEGGEVHASCDPRVRRRLDTPGLLAR